MGKVVRSRDKDGARSEDLAVHRNNRLGCGRRRERQDNHERIHGKGLGAAGLSRRRRGSADRENDDAHDDSSGST
jgi:hypothetical protein